MAAVPKLLALDCEMVGWKGRNLLAQVSIVDISGKVVYTKYALPPEGASFNNINYRTKFSGVTKNILSTAKNSANTVSGEVLDIIRGNIVVGHGLINDFNALELPINSPDYQIIDTATTPAFMKPDPRTGKLQPNKLKNLALWFLGKEIQGETHDPTEDAVTAMQLVMTYGIIFDITEETVKAEYTTQEEWNAKVQTLFASKQMMQIMAAMQMLSPDFLPATTNNNASTLTFSGPPSPTNTETSSAASSPLTVAPASPSARRRRQVTRRAPKRGGAGEGFKYAAKKLLGNANALNLANTRKALKPTPFKPSPLVVPVGVSERTRNFIMNVRRSGQTNARMEKFIQQLVDEDLRAARNAPTNVVSSHFATHPYTEENRTVVN